MTTQTSAPQQDDRRVPPQDLAAEESALGGMMLDEQVVDDVVALLKTRDYYRPAHGLIHEAIVDLRNRNEPTDAVSVSNELVKRGQATQTFGASYIHKLVNTVPTAANAEYYAGIVREKAILRRLVEAGTRIAQMGYDGEGTVEEILDRALFEIQAVANDRTDTDLPDITEITVEVMEEVEQAANSKGQLIGVPTGFEDLDSLTQGLRPGQLVVVGARPAIGKSVLATDLTRSCAIKHKQPALFFSLEMSRTEIVQRMIAAEKRVALHHMRSGQMTDEDWTRMAEAIAKINESPLHIDDRAELTAMEMRAVARRVQRQHGLALVVVDYMQLASAGTGKWGENRQGEVSYISRQLKLMAKELQVPVVALSQLNRNPENRSDKRPALADLRESGSLEQDADMVILLHREDAYEKESPRSGEGDFIVAKHRNGPTATITVAFQGHYARYVDMAQG